MLDDRNETTSSHEINDIGVWDRKANILARKAILGDLPSGAAYRNIQRPHAPRIWLDFPRR